MEFVGQKPVREERKGVWRNSRERNLEALKSNLKLMKSKRAVMWEKMINGAESQRNHILKIFPRGLRLD